MIISMLIDATVVGSDTKVSFVLAHIEAVSPRTAGTHVYLASGEEWAVNEQSAYFMDALEAYHAFARGR
jgi:hypothetical protein